MRELGEKKRASKKQKKEKYMRKGERDRKHGSENEIKIRNLEKS